METIIIENQQTKENVNRILWNFQNPFGEYNPEQAEQQRIEKENRLKAEQIKEQNKIEKEKENRWQKINEQWKIEVQEQYKKDIAQYRKQLQEQKIPVELLTDAEIYICEKYWGTKICRDVIYNKCKILI